MTRRAPIRLVRRTGTTAALLVAQPLEQTHATCTRGCGSALPPERRQGGVCKPCIDADMKRRGLDKLKPGDGLRPELYRKGGVTIGRRVNFPARGVKR